jgi:hypothetical protein
MRPWAALLLMLLQTICINAKKDESQDEGREAYIVSFPKVCELEKRAQRCDNSYYFRVDEHGFD